MYQKKLYSLILLFSRKLQNVSMKMDSIYAKPVKDHYTIIMCDLILIGVAICRLPLAIACHVLFNHFVKWFLITGTGLDKVLRGSLKSFNYNDLMENLLANYGYKHFPPKGWT
jgi:hypothetical protein